MRLTRPMGFTLVELLVVIAIITVLASMLLPVLDQSLAEARKIQCCGNLRQLGVAAQCYGADYEDRLPPTNVFSGSDWTYVNFAYNQSASSAYTEKYGIVGTRSQNLAYLKQANYISGEMPYFCPEDKNRLSSLGNWKTSTVKGSSWPLLTSIGGVTYSYFYNPYGAFGVHNYSNNYAPVAHPAYPKFSVFPSKLPMAMDDATQYSWHDDSWNLLFIDSSAKLLRSKMAGDYFRLYAAVSQATNARISLFNTVVQVPNFNDSSYLHGEKNCRCGQ